MDISAIGPKATVHSYVYDSDKVGQALIDIRSYAGGLKLTRTPDTHCCCLKSRSGNPIALQCASMSLLA